MRANVDAFLRTGELAGIALGTSREEVIRSLGPPDGVSDKKRPAEILRYGRIQLHVEALGVVLIAIQFGDDGIESSSASFEGWCPSPRISAADFEEALRARGIQFEADQYYLQFNQHVLRVLGSLVRAVFDQDES